MNQGGINAPLMGIELLTIGQVAMWRSGCGTSQVSNGQFWRKIKNVRVYVDLGRNLLRDT